MSYKLHHIHILCEDLIGMRDFFVDTLEAKFSMGPHGPHIAHGAHGHMRPRRTDGGRVAAGGWRRTGGRRPAGWGIGTAI